MESGVSLRKWSFRLTLLALLLYSLPSLDFGGRHVSFWEQVARLARDFFPPDLSVLPEILRALNETLQIATLSTFLAVILSCLLALAASQATGSLASRIGARFVLAVIRTIPGLIWAVLAVALIGPSSRAGVFALTFYSIGYLGKFFADILDQADRRPALWLLSQGARPWQVFQFTLWPELRAALASQSLWMWEYNVRSAAIIGYVGAGGLGLQLHIYQEFGQWDRFSTALIVILLVVIAVELTSEMVKKRTRQLRFRKTQ